MYLTAPSERHRRDSITGASEGQWYSRIVGILLPDARVFVCVPGSGYVGVGTVREVVVPVRSSVVDVEDQTVPILDAPLVAPVTDDTTQFYRAVPSTGCCALPSVRVNLQKSFQPCDFQCLIDAGLRIK